MSELKKKKIEISSLLIMIEKIFSRPKSRTEKTFFKQSILLLHWWLGARYSRSIPPTFENKLRCYKQRFGKIAGGEHSCIR